MQSTKVKPIYLVIGFLTLGLDSAPSYAQGESVLLEEILVTATRREESAATIPISITALSSEQLEAFRMENIADVQTLTPNFSVYQVVGGSNEPITSIRGILNRSSNATEDATVGIYQDEVYLARGYSVMGQMLDTERVEVLRGPQGTLFGRNTTGGAVQIVSRSAEIGGETDGYARFTAGNYGLYEGKAAATIQLGDAAALRVAGSLTQRDGYTDSYLVDDTFSPPNGQFGYIDGVTPAEKFDTHDADNHAFRVSLAWAPSENGLFNLSYYQSKGENNGVLNQGILGDLGGPGSTPAGRSSFSTFYSGLTKERTRSSRDVDIVIGKYEHDFANDVSLKLIASHAESESSEVFNTDGIVTSGTPLTLKLLSFLDGEVSQSTFEIQVSGSNGNLDWITGLYYFEEDADDQNVSAVTSDLVGLGVLPPPAEIAFSTQSFVDVTVANESASVFGSLSYALSEDLKLRAGGRYTEDTKGYDGRTTSRSPLLPFPICAYTGAFVMPGGACTSQGVIPGSVDFDNISWDISLDYQINDVFFAFAKVATGYRSGGISLGANSVATAVPFTEDEVISYELGLKTRIGNTARIDVTLYASDYSDVQQNVNSTGAVSCAPTVQPIIVTCNLGDADVKGFELEASWQVTESFGLRASYGYVDFEYKDVDLELVFVPESSYDVTATYDAQIGNVPIRALLSYRESDEWISSDSISVLQEATIEGYSLLDARITASFGESIDVSVWGKNITEDEYYSSALTAPTPVFFARSGIAAPPQTYGLDISYRF